MSRFGASNVPQNGTRDGTNRRGTRRDPLKGVPLSDVPNVPAECPDELSRLVGKCERAVFHKGDPYNRNFFRGLVRCNKFATRCPNGVFLCAWCSSFLGNSVLYLDVNEFRKLHTTRLEYMEVGADVRGKPRLRMLTPVPTLARARAFSEGA